MKKSCLFFAKALVAFHLIFSATAANAAWSWIDNLTVKKVQFYYNGYYTLRVYVNEPINTGCPEDAQGFLTARTSSAGPNIHMSSMQSLLQQAKASGSKVSILYEHACATGNGAPLHGVSLNEES